MEDYLSVGSINDAKALLRTIQEKLYVENIDVKEIFNVTIELNNYLDKMAANMYEENKNNN